MKIFLNKIRNNTTIPILLTRVMNTITITSIIILLSRNLSTHVYGNYVNFWITLTLAISVGSIGLAAVLYNFSTRGWIEFYNNLHPRKLLLFLLYITCITALCVLFLYHNLDAIESATLVSLAVVIFGSIISFILDNVLIISERSFTQLFLNTLYSIALISIHTIYIYEHQDMNELLFWYAIIISTKSVLQYIIFHFTKKHIAAQSHYSQLPILTPDHKNWIQMSINEVLQFVMRYLDKFILNILATKELAAVYFNGRQDIPFLSAIYTSLGHGLLIELSKKINTSNQQLLESINNTLKKLSGIILCITAFAWIYSEEIFIVVFTEKYIESIPIFKAGLLLLPAQYLLSITYILQYKSHSEIINKGAYFDAILILILAIPSYYLFGPIGIIISIIISTYIQNIYYLVKIAQILKTPYHRLIPYTYYIVSSIVFISVGLLSHYIFDKFFSDTYTLIFGIILGGIMAGISFFMTKNKNQIQNNIG